MSSAHGAKDGAYERTDARTDPKARREDVVPAQKRAYGGVKIGSAFFGWLTATGMAVLLTAVLTAAGAAVGVASNTTPEQAAGNAVNNPATIGWAGAVLLGVILFIAYYCGGYVAGRMARFHGARQGVAVWVWALIIVIAVAAAGAIAGSNYDILSRLDSFPRIPIGQGDLTTAGIIALLLALAISLAGAILGGLAGMRFHRKVDKAALGA